MPPARISGICSVASPSLTNSSRHSSSTRENENRSSLRSSMRAAPRCPPACAGCSITTASGSRAFFIQRLSTTPTPRASDRIGISATLGCSAVISGRSSGSPAPMTIASAPLSHACRTSAACDSTAFITFTAIRPLPWLPSRAARISRSSATRLAALMAALSCDFSVAAARSAWWWRRSMLAMVPTPPSRATAPASRCAEMPTPIPPCTMGTRLRPASVNRRFSMTKLPRGAAALH